MQSYEELDFELQWSFWRKGTDGILVLAREDGNLVNFLHVISEWIKKSKPLLHLQAHEIENLFFERLEL